MSWLSVSLSNNTTNEASSNEATRAAKAGFDLDCAAGGDGTINEELFSGIAQQNINGGYSNRNDNDFTLAKIQEEIH